MKNIVKILFLVVALQFSMFPFATLTTKAQSNGEKGVEILFSVGVQSKTLFNLIDEFNSLNSYNFTVKLIQSTWQTNSQYKTYTIKFREHDSNIDLMPLRNTWLSNFAKSGYLEPLDDVFPQSERSEFFQSQVEAGTVDENIYAIPWLNNNGMLFYRTDVLSYASNQGIIPENRPPETWDELHDWTLDMLADSTLVNKFNITQGFVWQGFPSNEDLFSNFLEYLGGTGKDTILNNYQSQSDFDNNNVRNTLTYMKSLIDDGVSPGAVLAYTESQSLTDWKSGKSIFARSLSDEYRSGLHSIYLNGRYNGDNIQQFNMTIMPVQNTTVTNAKLSCLDSWQLGVNAFSEYKDEAKAFIKWMTDYNQQKAFFLQGEQDDREFGCGYGSCGNSERGYPTRKAFYQDPDITTGQYNYVVNLFPLFNSDLLIQRPATSFWDQISEVVRESMGRYLRGDITLENAITTMNGDVQDVLDGNPIRIEKYSGYLVVIGSLSLILLIITIKLRKNHLF